MSNAVPTKLYYRFSCSMLLVAGSCERTSDWDTGAPRVVPTADVSLFSAADARRPIVRLPQLGGSHDVSVKLAPDGRLAAVSGTTRGLIGDVIEASVAVGSFAAGLIGAVVAPRLPALPAVVPAVPAGARALVTKGPRQPAKRAPAARWRELDPDGDATRLGQARDALVRLHDAVITRGRETADAERPGAAVRRMAAVRVAIAEVEREIAEIDRRRQAWFNTVFRTVESYEFVFPVDAAFRLAAGDAPETINASQLQSGSEQARAVLENLYVAVVELDDSDADRPPDDGTITNVELDNEKGEAPPGIHFRIPRQATIALYVDASDRDSTNPNRPLTLRSVDRHWVVDADSRYGSVPLKGEDDLTASATFSADGLLETVSLDAQGKLEALIDAFKAAPGVAAQGLSQAKGVVETWDALRSTRIKRQLDALESRKEQLELAIASRGLEADAAERETLQMLKDRLERVKTSRDLKPGDPDAEAVRDAERAELAARLRVELQIARMQRQLAAYKDD